MGEWIGLINYNALLQAHDYTTQHHHQLANRI